MNRLNNKSLMEVLKANIFLSQCIITILNNIVNDYKLEKTENKHLYENVILKNLSAMKTLSSSLEGSLQNIIKSLDNTEIENGSNNYQ